jgi:hypothetical protein
MHTELSILSAEQYDDGVHFRPGGVRVNPHRKLPAGLVDDDAPQKKRAKTKRPAVDDMDLDDESGKKRSRGRPRLDTKDETAADVSMALPTVTLALCS